MNYRRLLLALAVLAFVAFLLFAHGSARAATSEPHVYALDPAISCTSCHQLHNAPGLNYTVVAGNANLCASCHNQNGLGATFGWPWYTQNQASPLAAQRSGDQHRWDAPATSPSFGADPPLATNMKDLLDTVTTPGTPRIQCSTCHDSHNSNPQFGGTQHVSVALGTALPRTSGTSGTTSSGTMTVQQPSAAAVSKAYLVEIWAAGNVGVATYRLSHDAGNTWLGWNGTAWVAWNATTPNPRTTATTDQYLDDGTNIRVAFGGSNFVKADRWRFYIGYPNLRASIIASQMCEDCHRSMVHSSVRARGEDATYLPDGVRKFSHPVGEVLGANGGGYDQAAPLRVDGTVQTATVAYGDLLMSNETGGAKVRCLTCHKVHEAHSNSVLNP